MSTGEAIDGRHDSGQVASFRSDSVEALHLLIRVESEKRPHFQFGRIFGSAEGTILNKNHAILPKISKVRWKFTRKAQKISVRRDVRQRGTRVA